MKGATVIRTLVILAVVGSASSGAVAAIPEDAARFSKDQFDAYCRFSNFISDEKTLKRYRGEARAARAFARAEKMKKKDLLRLVEVGKTVGNCTAFKPIWEQRLKTELAAIAKLGDVVMLFDEQAFEARIDWSEVNVSNTAHVIVWVSWKFADLRFVEEESALVGAAVIKAIPAVGTLSISSHKGKKKRMVFEAKVYGSNLHHVDSAQAGVFSKTRYWRFFENIRFHRVLRRKLRDGETLIAGAKTEPKPEDQAQN
jgi:hypothetical protein